MLFALKFERFANPRTPFATGAFQEAIVGLTIVRVIL
jgi:hypothetical protein